MYRPVLPTCMHGHHVSDWCLKMSEDHVGPPKLELGVIVSSHVGART